MSEESIERLTNELPPTYEDDDFAEVVGPWQRRKGWSGKAWSPELGIRAVIEMLQTGLHRQWGHNAVGRADNQTLVETCPVPLLAMAGDNEMLLDASKRAAEIAPRAEYAHLGATGLDIADEAPDAFVDACLTFFESK